jgi:site-specific DNA recombinase
MPIEANNLIVDECEKVKEQASRYYKAYGDGLISIEKLREIILPINKKVKALEEKLKETYKDKKEISTEFTVPTREQLQDFALKSAEVLADLKFESKRAIVLEVIKRVVGTNRELSISGCLPAIQNVNYKTNDRHGQNTTQHFQGDKRDSISFQIMVKL